MLMRSFVVLLAAVIGALGSAVTATAQWEKVPGFDGRFFDEVFFTDADHGWAAESFSPRIVFTTDGGASWSSGFLPGAAGSKMRDLAFVDDRIGFATGSDGLFRTTDGGRTWSDISPIPITTIPAVWFRNASEGVIALGSCNEDQVLFMHTADGGRTWNSSQYTVDMDASVGGIRYENGTWYAAGGMGKIWTSANGDDWIVSNSGSGGWQEDIDVVGGTIFTASTLGGSCESDGSGRLMVLPAGETQWLQTDPVATFPFWGVSALSPSEAWACGDQGSVYQTTDGGHWWKRHSCGIDAGAHVDDIAFPDANHGWAVGDGIYRYTGRIDILPVTVSQSFSLCAGEQARLDASGGDAYHWEPAAGLSDPDVANPVVTATTTTTYTVTVTSESGCTGEASVTVTVLPRPTAQVAQSQLTICTGGSVQLHASGGTSYRWEPATGLSDASIADPIARPSVTTAYRVIVDNGACADTADVTVTVGAPGAALELPEVTADVRDDDVAIPIRTEGPLAQTACAAETMTLTLAFNASLYFPRTVSRGRITDSRIVGGERQLTIAFDRAELASVTDVLTTITGNAMLGNATETPIDVVAITFNGASAPPIADPGRLVLTGICTEGDSPRLLAPRAFGIDRIVPNPSRGAATVEIRTQSVGRHILEVYALDGRLAWSTAFSSDGTTDRYTFALPADLGNGAYQVVLRADDRRDVETLIITK
jgi:photosystem II stability/assembly factor-like uncharacterized protein